MAEKRLGQALVVFVERRNKNKGYNSVKTDTTENAEGVPWKAYGFRIKLGYEDTGKRLPTKYDFKEIPLAKQLK